VFVYARCSTHPHCSSNARGTLCTARSQPIISHCSGTRNKVCNFVAESQTRFRVLVVVRPKPPGCLTAVERCANVHCGPQQPTRFGHFLGKGMLPKLNSEHKRESVTVRNVICFGLVFSVFCVAGVGSAFSEEALTSRLLQDEIQELPSQNTAFFTAAREASIQLDLLAAVGGEVDEETLVSIVSPSGQTRNLRPDSNGMVYLDQVESGPHAIMATNRRAHGTSLVYFKEQPAADRADDSGDGRQARNARSRKPGSAKVNMLEVSSRQLRPYVDRVRGVSGPMSSVKRSVSSNPQQAAASLSRLQRVMRQQRLAESRRQPSRSQSSYLTRTRYPRSR